MLQEAFCYDVDSLTTVRRPGKGSGGAAVDTHSLLKVPYYTNFLMFIFLSPPTPVEQRCMINYSKKKYSLSFLFLGLQPRCSVGRQEERPAVGVRCQHPFVMSERADFHSSVFWCRVEEADRRH